MADRKGYESSSSNRFFTSWRIGLASIFALVVSLYFPALKGKLVWDDEPLVNGSTYGTHDLISAFTHPFGNFFRPLTSASFALEKPFSNGSPFFYHQTNLVLHALTAILVAYLGLLLTKDKTAGLLSGMFFAAQPMQVGATAWIGGRTDVLSAFFLTIFLVSLLRYYQNSRVGWMALSVVAFLLAALSKEQAVAMLPAVPLSVFVFGTREWKQVWRLSVPFGLAIVLYAVLWHIGGPPLRSVQEGVSEILTLTLRTAAHYGLAFLVPNKPSLVTFTLEPYKSFLWVPLGATLLVGAGLLLRSGWKNNRALAWIALCGLLVYIPISNCPPVPSLVLGPYRCTQAGIAVACLFGTWAASSLQSKRYVTVGLMAANFAFGMIVTWWGIHQWLSPEGFFAEVAESDPHFIVGVQFDAHYLDDEGKSREAANLTGRTLTWLFDSDRWADVLDRDKRGAITPAVISRLRTNTGRINVNALGSFIATNAFSLARIGRIPEAAVAARDALIFLPKDTWINMLYGRLILRTDRAEAMRHWELALSINPDYGDCGLALAHQRIIDHRYPEAIALLDRALKQMGNNGYGWLDLADAKIALHDYAGAARALDKAEHADLKPRPGAIELRRRTIESELRGWKRDSRTGENREAARA